MILYAKESKCCPSLNQQISRKTHASDVTVFKIRAFLYTRIYRCVLIQISFFSKNLDFKSPVLRQCACASQVSVQVGSSSTQRAIGYLQKDTLKSLLSLVPNSSFVVFGVLPQAILDWTNQQPPQLGGAVSDPVWVGSKWLLAFPRVPVIPGTRFAQIIFSPCRGAARSFFEIGRLSSLFSYLSLSRLRLLILLLILMSGNIPANPGPVFPCSVCDGNVTWRGRSLQCCTWYKWVHIRCSLLSSKFRTLGSSHSWSCPLSTSLLLLEIPHLPTL